MNFNPIKWKTKTLAYVGLSFFGFYFLCVYKWTHDNIYEFTIKNSKAEHVWEFVADFSNMLKLNPLIEEFNIIDDSGDYDHWKYVVQYKERLNNLPRIQNTAHGFFSVKPKTDGYVIESNHHTCFFMGIICLNSNSEFIFEPQGEDTKCIEKIQYECPLLFSIICHKEVTYARQEIMKNLQSHFINK